MASASEQAIQLAEGLLTYCGIDPEGFRETNKALIALDYETVIIIAVNGQLIHLVAMLGPVPDSPQLHRQLLNRNFASLAESDYRYAIDPDTGELVMSICLGSEDPAPDRLIRQFTHMAEYATRWQRSIYAGESAIPASDPASGQPPISRKGAAGDSPGASPGGLLRA